jgi:hypothetical protein
MIQIMIRKRYVIDKSSVGILQGADCTFEEVDGGADAPPMGVKDMQTIVMPIIHEYLVDGNLRDAVVRVCVYTTV